MSNTNILNPAAIISAITLVVAIISPVIVTILNNLHSVKMRKLELNHEKKLKYFQKQQEVFNNFLQATSCQIETDYTTSRTEFIRAYSELMLYIPDIYWDKFNDIYNFVDKRDKASAIKELSSVTKILGKILQEADL